MQFDNHFFNLISQENFKFRYTFYLPIKTVSEANSSEHWTKKNKRHNLQKWFIKILFKNNSLKINLPCAITLTRISPRKLDEHDNLRMCFKWIVDAISENITQNFRAGRSDDNKEIIWKYAQEKGEAKQYIVKIEIQEL